MKYSTPTLSFLRDLEPLEDPRSKAGEGRIGSEPRRPSEKRLIRALFWGSILFCWIFAAAAGAQEAGPADLPDVSVPVKSAGDGATTLPSGGASTMEASAILVPENPGAGELTSTTAPTGPEAELTFRPLEEQRADRPISQANQILNSTMEVIDFRDEELQDVLRLIAAKSRLNIIMQPEGVKGKVTLHLENVKLGTALDHILKSNGLAYVVSPDENIVRIVDAASVGFQKVETRTEVIQLNWVDAVKLTGTLSDLFGNEAKLVPNQDTNALIVTSTPPNLQTIRELIAKADVAERQVLIEARLVDLTHEAQRVLGSDLSLWRADSAGVSPATIGGKAVDLLSSRFPVSTGGKGLDWNFGEVVSIFGQDFNLSGRLQAFEERNMVEILANPRVVTLNNIPAKISIVQKVPYSESVIGVSGATTIEVEFEDVGVEIGATPIITANGFVRMALLTSQKIFRGRVGTGALAPPLIDHRDANTNVIVKGGDTVMIGGLRELRSAERAESVPWFGQIPVLGWLFKNKQNDESKTELVLFVTPTIIEQQEGLTVDEQCRYGKIDTKWHLPDYFFDDVKTNYEK